MSTVINDNLEAIKEAAAVKDDNFVQIDGWNLFPGDAKAILAVIKVNPKIGESKVFHVLDRLRENVDKYKFHMEQRGKKCVGALHEIVERVYGTGDAA